MSARLIAPLTLLATLAACGGSEPADQTSEAPTAPSAAMQADIADGKATLERNIGDSDEDILQAGLPYRLPIVPDGKVIRTERGGQYVVVETAFPPSLAATFYEQAGKEAGFTTSRVEGSGGITVSGKDGERAWRIAASAENGKTKISFHQTGD